MTYIAATETTIRAETRRKHSEILDAAVEVFGSKGYTNGRLADIADRAGMTHAGVLHHFGSKQELLVEVLAYCTHANDENPDEQPIPDSAEFFLDLVHTGFADEQRPDIAKAYAVLSAESVADDHPAQPFFERRYSRLRSEIAEALVRLCDQEGVTERENVEAASAAILGILSGLQAQSLLSSSTLEVGPASELAIRAIVNAVVHPGF
ncbi:TetR/AcrR family transcriptional regulator [Microbacterium sp. B2969]|uniref:TetR/AcrR family transcriptional regulator n=1 Tax=Microbacterium alkaliflavum TaxID=3248839 RepID=A0ABW7QDS7_9MICO